MRRILADKGFATYAKQKAESHWSVWCRRQQGPSEKQAAGDGPATWHQPDGVHIDVRNMEAPAPLTAILGLIDGGQHGEVVIVHHNRKPIYLFPELTERGWSWSQLLGDPGEVRLALHQGIH